MSQGQPNLMAETLSVFVKRPFAFLGATILPTIAVLVILFGIGRVVRMGLAASSGPVDPEVMWHSLSVGTKLLWLLLFIVSASSIRGVAISGIAMLTTDCLRQENATFASVLWRMLQLAPQAAVIASIVGVLAFPGMFLILVPGLLVETVFAFAVITATLEGSGIISALRKSVALTRGMRLKILGLFLLSGAMMLFGQILMGAISVFSLAVGVITFLLWAVSVGTVAQIVLVLMYRTAAAAVANQVPG